MRYESITVRSWRMTLGVVLLVGTILAALPIHPTLAVNSTGDDGTTRTTNPPCNPLARHREQSIDGVVVKAEGPRGTGSAYNPSSAQPSTRFPNKAAITSAQYWSLERSTTDYQP